MQRRKNYTLFLVIILVILSAATSGIIVVFTNDSIWAQAITTVTAVVGAFAIWFEMRKGKRLNEGEFIVQLNKQFLENQQIQELYLKMEKYERSNKKQNPFNEDDITKILSYATFYEVIYLLLKRNIIKIGMIDQLFSYQFFLMINNPKIQDLEILPCQKYYANIFCLYHEWVEYRKRRDEDVLNEEHSILKRIDQDLLCKLKGERSEVKKRKDK